MTPKCFLCANQKPFLIVTPSVSDAAFLIWRTPGCYLRGALRDQLINKGFERDQDTLCYFLNKLTLSTAKRILKRLTCLSSLMSETIRKLFFTTYLFSLIRSRFLVFHGTLPCDIPKTGSGGDYKIMWLSAFVAIELDGHVIIGIRFF